MGKNEIIVPPKVPEDDKQEDNDFSTQLRMRIIKSNIHFDFLFASIICWITLLVLAIFLFLLIISFEIYNSKNNPL